MAETFTYDPSNDPQVVEAAEQRDAETLAVAEELDQQQNQLLAGKYKSAQDLEQAYIELQKKLGSQETEEEEESSDTEEAETDPFIDVFESADEEFSSNGELSEATLEKLSNMSSADLVKAYLEYQSQFSSDDTSVAPVELTEQQVNNVYNSVGGEKQYQEIVQWASKNLSEQEIQAFDNVIESGNLDAINFATQALKFRYTDSVGFEGNLIQGKAAAPADVFRSQAELVRAMNDSRYDNDPAYRMSVMDKLSRSDISF